jgi:phosphopantothenoylcysteine synthetase/decarboxylase
LNARNASGIDYNEGMNLLITAGNTQTPIDRVRCLTNVFTARTGTSIAVQAHGQGHHVTLLTSRPEAILEVNPLKPLADQRWRPLRFRTTDDLDKLMGQELQNGNYDALIHSAAVSDYTSAGIFSPAPGTRFEPDAGTWTGTPPTLLDRAAAKVKSDEPELWLRLVRAPKLVDKVRTDWSFKGILVKFKLEVGISEEHLLEIAERSRLQSKADLMVANTLEGAHDWAFLGPQGGKYQRIQRRELPERLLEAIENSVRNQV